MSGAVAQRANGMSKALGGKVTFFYALTRVFLEWENTEVTVTLDDGERRGRMHDVIVANGAWHGGGMKLAPDALAGRRAVRRRPDRRRRQGRLPDDGAEDLQGQARRAPEGRGRCASTRVEVDAAERLPIEVEGEQVGTTPAVFEVVPGALRVRVPR